MCQFSHQCGLRTSIDSLLPRKHSAVSSSRLAKDTLCRGRIDQRELMVRYKKDIHNKRKRELSKSLLVLGERSTTH
ncbi:hypothetical protein KCU59_g103, partial [Aureobasidium melanogenum]